MSNSRRDELVELDAVDLSVVRRIETGKVPKDFRVSADERTAYVANWSGNSLSVIDLETEQRVDVPTGRHARGVALAPDDSEIYVMNFGAASVAVVDATSIEVVATIRTCKNPRHAVVAGNELLVTCFGARHVAVIDRAERKAAARPNPWSGERPRL